MLWSVDIESSLIVWLLAWKVVPLRGDEVRWRREGLPGEKTPKTTPPNRCHL